MTVGDARHGRHRYMPRSPWQHTDGSPKGNLHSDLSFGAAIRRRRQNRARTRREPTAILLDGVAPARRRNPAAYLAQLRKRTRRRAARGSPTRSRSPSPPAPVAFGPIGVVGPHQLPADRHPPGEDRLGQRSVFVVLPAHHMQMRARRLTPQMQGRGDQVQIRQSQAAQLRHPQARRIQRLDHEAVPRVVARVHQRSDLVAVMRYGMDTPSGRNAGVNGPASNAVRTRLRPSLLVLLRSKLRHVARVARTPVITEPEVVDA